MQSAEWQAEARVCAAAGWNEFRRKLKMGVIVEDYLGACTKFPLHSAMRLFRVWGFYYFLQSSNRP